MAAGTDPTRAESVLRIDRAPKLGDLSASEQDHPNSDELALYFQSVPGVIYDIQSADVLGGSWKTEATVTATSAQKRVLLGKPDSKGFYRVLVSP